MMVLDSAAVWWLRVSAVARAFLGDYKYWLMEECADVDLDAHDTVLNRALLYRDRRDFVIHAGDTGWRER